MLSPLNLLRSFALGRLRRISLIAGAVLLMAGLAVWLSFDIEMRGARAALSGRLLEKGSIIHGVAEFFKYDVVPMLGARDRIGSPLKSGPRSSLAGFQWAV